MGVIDKLSAPRGAMTPARADKSSSLLRRLALTSLVANVVIVVTGGAVRLTDSGLGCPTWPKCTDDSLTPTSKLTGHGVIEFANRSLTGVIALVAIATWLVAMAQRRERRLATFAALGIPAQAVLGGITVRTDLNPWAVAAHFLLSMVLIAVTLTFWTRLREDPPSGPVPRAAVLLARVTAAVAAATLVLGTIVTGSGPHAGDKVEGNVRRTGLNVASMAQLHADAVLALIGLSVGLLVLTYAVRAEAPLRQAAAVLVGVEFGQGAIGYTQYFLDVPPLLVAVHMLGACLVWIAALRVVLAARPALTA